VETFKFSTEPELEWKIRDVVGLYLAPPEKAVVVCVDEKTQIQALDRTAPMLPLRPGLPDQELGGTYFTQRDPERATRRAINALNQLGYTVTLNPLESAA
jgi:hypothetical protein